MVTTAGTRSRPGPSKRSASWAWRGIGAMLRAGGGIEATSDSSLLCAWRRSARSGVAERPWDRGGRDTRKAEGRCTVDGDEGHQQ